jgi:DNA-binding transcriptional regulator YdaS (Cro superfamily)
MTLTELRSITNSLNPGGQTKLAVMLGWSPRTVRNKLAGKTSITRADELAIVKALENTDGLVAQPDRA